MKDFNKIEQSNDSSASQWEMTPAEIAEMKEEQGRRELWEHINAFEQSDDYDRAKSNFNTRKFIMDTEMRSPKKAQDRLEELYWDANIKSKEYELKSENRKREQRLKEERERNNETIAIVMRKKEELQYANRGKIKKLTDWIKHGFSEDKVKDSYFGESLRFVQDNDIKFYSRHDGGELYVDKHTLGPISDGYDTIFIDKTVEGYEKAIHDKTTATEDAEKSYNHFVEGSDNKLRQIKHEAVLKGYSEQRNRKVGYDGVNVKAVAKSIRRNQKKNQK